MAGRAPRPTPREGPDARSARSRRAPEPVLIRTRARAPRPAAPAGPPVGERVGRAVTSAGGALKGAHERRRMVVAARKAASAGHHSSVDHRKRLLLVLAVLATLFALLASKVVDLQVMVDAVRDIKRELEIE